MNDKADSGCPQENEHQQRGGQTLYNIENPFKIEMAALLGEIGVAALQGEIEYPFEIGAATPLGEIGYLFETGVATPLGDIGKSLSNRSGHCNI